MPKEAFRKEHIEALRALPRLFMTGVPTGTTFYIDWRRRNGKVPPMLVLSRTGTDPNRNTTGLGSELRIQQPPKAWELVVEAFDVKAHLLAPTERIGNFRLTVTLDDLGNPIVHNLAHL